MTAMTQVVLPPPEPPIHEGDVFTWGSEVHMLTSISEASHVRVIDRTGLRSNLRWDELPPADQWPIRAGIWQGPPSEPVSATAPTPGTPDGAEGSAAATGGQ